MLNILKKKDVYSSLLIAEIVESERGGSLNV